MTITISYSAFFLAFGIGLFGLGYVIRGEDKYSDQVRALVMGSYRAIQVGVSFLAPGIILGGVWADYSWGRFWGWDPKETWALIVLLGYVALLHARLVGWVKHFGMLASAVLGFLLVIMAWYGVNFVLGAGLHSYGFGAGGVEYVAAFSVLCLAYVGFAFIRHSKSLGRSAHSAAN
jgi:ABC-type transport system involved in cytochrome c biogenesis permease subunit